MERFSALLVLCAGNSPVTGEFPAQRSVTRSFDIFFDLCLNKRLSKQSWGWRFETPSCSLWRHCNDLTILFKMGTDPVQSSWDLKVDIKINIDHKANAKYVPYGRLDIRKFSAKIPRPNLWYYIQIFVKNSHSVHIYEKFEALFNWDKKMFLMYLKVYWKHWHFAINCTDRTGRYVVYLSCALHIFTPLFSITVILESGGVIARTTFPSSIALVIVNMSVARGSFHVATIVFLPQFLYVY